MEQVCDPPLERVDTAAFAARALAERFHATLADAGLACTRLAITAVTERDAVLSRIWRCAAPLTAAATADRLRWQLDGWLTAGRTTSVTAGPGAITRLKLEPIEAIGAGRIQYGLWGSDGQDDQRAGWAFARVQGLLGPESVLAPVRSGGRSPADRVTLVPWGDEKVGASNPADPWPGSLPAPSPARVINSDSPEIARFSTTPAGSVQLTGRGAADRVACVAGEGHAASDRRVGGPWLLDERWWSTDRRPTSARVQLVTDDGIAVLARSTPGGWQIEGVYD